MPLRNLNRSYPRGRICGTPKTGVKGSQIASAGENGPGYLFRYLNLPTDNEKEYAGYIPYLPPGLTFTATENSAFIASAADGVYVVPVDVTENGVPLFSTTFNIVFGAVDVVIPGAVGSALASGLSASLLQASIVSALVAEAFGDGLTALITESGVTTVFASVGQSVAAGDTAQIQLATTVSTAVGAAAAAGQIAAVTNRAPGERTLTDADVAAIADAMWAHPNGVRALKSLAYLMGSTK